MEQAAERAGKTPKTITTDKLNSYLDGIELAFGADTRHKQGGPFDIDNNTNLIERFHGTLKQRTKVMRGLKDIKTAREFTDGWLIHYNYFRPHEHLDNRTPAVAAKVKYQYRNWADVVNSGKPVNTVAVPTSLWSDIPVGYPYQANPRKLIPRTKPIRKRTPRVTRKTPQISLQAVYVSSKSGTFMCSRRPFRGAKKVRVR